MAITNSERVGKALELLKSGLGPFVDRETKNAYKADAELQIAILMGDDRLLANKYLIEWDVAPLLKLVWESWNDIFRNILGFAERSLVSELRDIRNKWAHQNPFSSDDTYRALDSASRLLNAISATSQTTELDKMKMDLLRVRFDEQARTEKRKNIEPNPESAPMSHLKPWREVATPHKDVASGRYIQAEFAADLHQVYLGEGSEEYLNPTEFFRRTFLTDSLKRLLVSAAMRLSNQGGDPVVQLQTNFGGGKTHSMLALYHLCAGKVPTELLGVGELLESANIKKMPSVKRVVLVGNKISPGSPSLKPDGTLVHTLWGELAWQLGGKTAFERIRADDEMATNPGDNLRALLNDYGPCLILIDEWVAYARQLHDEKNLPGGDFGTQFTFAQTLTESAKLAKGCLLVISLPASESAGTRDVSPDDVEVGGRRGREALNCLRNVIGRIESPWRPASAEESFEIVRKRLFEPLAGEGYKDRDVTARSFSDFYRKQTQEFPPECSEERYEQRLKAAYPLHPELFERLYTDWSSNPQFQRTRGILRLMAAVIYHLWEQGDKNPLIMPGNIPIDHVQSELTRYLPDRWRPILESDVDGPRSLPWRLDRDLSSSLGKHQICRRVARTIWMGSAPVSKAANYGIEDRRIKLGCALPGEQLAQFGDALRRLSDVATYLYSDGPRYWYSTQPTVSKLAEERAEQFRRDRDKMMHELELRLRSDLKKSGDFSRIHPVPTSSADIPDDADARLVVLSADHSYSRDQKNEAEEEAVKILETSGTSPRQYRNALVFLAPDKTRLQELEAAISRFLAWKSIVDEEDLHNLTEHQKKQARTQNNATDQSVKAKISEVYQWLLVPHQEDPQKPIEWKTIRLNGGQESLAERASKRLKNDELLLTTYAPTQLRLDLKNMPFLWRGKHYIAIRQLMNDFGCYPYLPRLKNSDVLIQAVQNGFGLTSWLQDSFAYADSFDELTGRYRGLRPGHQIISVTSADSGLLVCPDAAIRQIEAEAPAPPVGTSNPSIALEVPSPLPLDTISSPKITRYFGTVTLEPTRVGRDASKIADAVITHLVGLLGSSVRITMEIEATIPEGVPEHVVRTVTENSREMKFQTHGFELK